MIPRRRWRDWVSSLRIVAGQTDELAFGLLASSLLSLTPESPFASTPRTQATSANRRLSSIQEADENAARKGSIVDEGKIVSPINENSSLDDIIDKAISTDNSREKKEK
jgi:hypothetical protein